MRDSERTLINPDRESSKDIPPVEEYPVLAFLWIILDILPVLLSTFKGYRNSGCSKGKSI